MNEKSVFLRYDSHGPYASTVITETAVSSEIDVSIQSTLHFIPEVTEFQV